MQQPRPDEPDYARLPRRPAPERTRWGAPVELARPDDPLAREPLRINGRESRSDNPDRYRQHGFYFNADNCIGCHACETACAEKNGLPPYLAYRSVGYVEGGSWPAYRRINISMACNHCENPVCLKGCPTRAYTKYAEYGAVLQDPDICFGCGYCTWVCPYNAPQLDLERGHVHKCNMCIDRLEAGLKPACVAACLGGALDFGVIETVPENRVQCEVAIPGFPDPSITHPNIRFQQAASTPDELARPDSVPVRYVRETPGRGEHRPRPDRDKIGTRREWGLRRLRSREDPLVIFTLATQLVVGAFLALFLGPRLGLADLAAPPGLRHGMLAGLFALQTLAIALSTLHLGRPHRFYRAFNNLRWSPVSREVASLAVFYNLMGGHVVLEIFPELGALLPAGWGADLREGLGWAAAAAGPATLWFMHRIYRIPARPFWNHWQVLTAFYGAALVLGGLAVLASWALAAAAGAASLTPRTVHALGGIVLAGLALEALGLWAHARAMSREGGLGTAAHLVQRTRFGKTWIARNAGIAVTAVLVAALAWQAPGGTAGAAGWLGAFLLAALVELVGRALFYVLVIPTTMPGAFFWKNPGFQEHAREVGLARMPQVGVLERTH